MRKSPGRAGFTIVELLTVIAIIAILAAIIFPVFATVRKNVYKAQCTTNLHSLAQALKMYKDDWKVYPDALYGYVYEKPGVGIVEQTFLFPGYVKEGKVGFRCPLAPQRSDDVLLMSTQHPVTGAASPFRYYAWDSYDGTRVPTQNGQYQLHYMRKWSPGAVSFRDDPRQLIYRNPPDTTVVTWCTYHRSYVAGEVEKGSIDLVLFLDGVVKPIPSDKMLPLNGDVTRPYRITPGG